MELGKTVHLDFVTTKISGAAIGSFDADITPTAHVFEDDNDTPIYLPLVTKRTGFDGLYRVKLDVTEANHFQKDHSYNLAVTYAMGGVPCTQHILQFIIEDTMEKLTNVAALLDLPVPDTFIPTMTVESPANPGTVDEQIPPDAEYRDEVLDLYDQVTKTWNDGHPHSAEAEAFVTFAEQNIMSYDIAKEVYRQEYDLQRVVQWRAYSAGKLINVTE